MKRFSIICVLIAGILLLHGCTSEGKSEFSKVNRMLAGIDTYTVTAEITVQGNKMLENYIVKQYFKYPDKYRLEAVSPEDKKGKVTVYDGSKLWIYHPQINQMFVLDNLKEVEETAMFPGHFAGSLFTGEEVSYSIVREEDSDLIAVKIITPGGNNYRREQILFIDSKSLKPVRMETYDSSGNMVVKIHYRDFLYNVKIDDKLLTGESLNMQS